VEVRHINRSSSATRQPEVDTSTNMLCLRASFNLYIVVRGPAARYGCVIDTLFHTLSRVDRARSAGPWTTPEWDTESLAGITQTFGPPPFDSSLLNY
jgi:hypothetical protein